MSLTIAEIAKIAAMEKEYTQKLESILRPEEVELKPYPPRVVTLKNEKTKMIIYQATRSEIPEIEKVLAYTLRTLMEGMVDRYYHIVAARTYAELLGWKYHRYRNIWFLVGKVGDEIVGVANGRLYDEKTGISLHTIALKPELGIGAHLAAAKWEYFFDILGVDKILLAIESPIGMSDLLKWKPEIMPGYQHELGGGTTFILLRGKWPEVKQERFKALGWNFR